MIEMTVVLRASGERTLAQSYTLLNQQISNDHIFVIEEKPFFNALKKSIKIALEQKSQWSIFLDADVLIRKNALNIIHHELKHANHLLYMMNFLVLDKGFGGNSYAGVHAFRTELFHKAKEFYALAEYDQRPETRLCKEMAKYGYPTMMSQSIVGLHDYEQYYRDLYRKMFVRALKFKPLLDYMTTVFKQHYKENDEYKVMYWGLINGLFYHYGGNKLAPLEPSFYLESSTQCLSMLNIEEKPPLLDTFYIDVEEIIDGFVSSDWYNKHATLIAPFPKDGLNYFGQYPPPSFLKQLISIKNILKR